MTFLDDHSSAIISKIVGSPIGGILQDDKNVTYQYSSNYKEKILAIPIKVYADDEVTFSKVDYCYGSEITSAESLSVAFNTEYQFGKILNLGFPFKYIGCLDATEDYVEVKHPVFQEHTIKKLRLSDYWDSRRSIVLVGKLHCALIDAIGESEPSESSSRSSPTRSSVSNVSQESSVDIHQLEQKLLAMPKLKLSL